jgi:hypothetical protein
VAKMKKLVAEKMNVPVESENRPPLSRHPTTKKLHRLQCFTCLYTCRLWIVGQNLIFQGVYMDDAWCVEDIPSTCTTLILELKPDKAPAQKKERELFDISGILDEVLTFAAPLPFRGCLLTLFFSNHARMRGMR